MPSSQQRPAIFTAPSFPHSLTNSDVQAVHAVESGKKVALKAELLSSLRSEIAEISVLRCRVGR